MLLFKTIFIFLFVICDASLFATGVIGFWQTIDKNTKQPTSVIAIYSYQGKYYGKIVATFNKQGLLSETLDKPKSRAPGVSGNPYYCGLDLIWACVPDGSGYYKGSVIDPKAGKRYNARLWKENGNLILRGEILMFGRNEILTELSKENFNPYFAQLNLKAFVPVSYKLKK